MKRSDREYLEKAELRFMRLILPGEPEECWNWKSYNKSTRPHFRFRGESIPAAKFSYEFFRGKKIRRGYVAHHICRNKRCVNPYHISEETYSDNILLG